MMRPVRFTGSPSLISLAPPSSTAPTLSSSRLRAMPNTPFPNSSISPAMARSTPWTRAMPSPTEMTLPTSATSISMEWLPSWSRMILEISSALMSMSFLLRPCVVARRRSAVLREPPLQFRELRRQAAVVHRAADARDDAADERRIHFRCERYLTRGGGAEPLLQRGLLLWLERDG